MKKPSRYTPTNPPADGIAVGANGKVYITNVDESLISMADQSGTRTWAKDDRFVWPDGLYQAPNGSVVVTVNQLNRAPAFNDGKSLAKKPYMLMRISGSVQATPDSNAPKPAAE